MNIPYKLPVVLALFSLVGCAEQFKPIPPGYITIGEIQFNSSRGEAIKTRFLYSVPIGYTPEKSYPLVIALHGGGDNMVAFHDLWKSVTDTMGFVLLTPQGDSPGPQNSGWTWGANGERAALICMDVVRKSVHLNDRRMYVAGFSAGGRLSYSLGFKHHDLFRGFAALSAGFDTTLTSTLLPSSNESRAFIGHGSLELSVGRQARTAVVKLRDAGYKVEYLQYDGIGHDLPEPKEAELRRMLKYLDS
jgi:phospholipase/carboxylesterase